MRKVMVAIIILLGLAITSCAGTSNEDKLIEGGFQSVEVYEYIHKSEKSRITMRDQDIIKQILNRINSLKRESADGMVFERGPEGLLVFRGEDEIIAEVPFFKDSGKVLYKNYLVESNLYEILK